MVWLLLVGPSHDIQQAALKICSVAQDALTKLFETAQAALRTCRWRNESAVCWPPLEGVGAF